MPIGLPLITLLIAGLPAAFILSLNVKTFIDTREWASSHNSEIYWNEKRYKEFRSYRGAIAYYLGYPGRRIAYTIYSRGR